VQNLQKTLTYTSLVFAKSRRSGTALALLLAFLRCAVPASGQVEIRRADQPAFTIESAEVADLSGLTWIEGNRFAAVSDKRKIVQYLTLEIDPATGRITAGELGKVVPVTGTASDFEAIAWVASEKAFYLAAERPGAILRVASGATRMPVPPSLAGARMNLGLESLTWNGVAKQFWIANEEALQRDGPVSSAETGTLVRLQKLNSRFRPLAQYAWRTEPASFRYHGAGSGVSDLCLLPGGQLIVLERGFGLGGLQLRLFLADFRGATEVSKIAALPADEVVPARKIPLYHEATGFTNFEGLALGPELTDGRRSLIVVADSNGTSTHTFRALTIRGASEKPRPVSAAPGATRTIP
jgi:hypothetical protein